MATSEATLGQTPDVYGQVHPIETPELIIRKMKEFEIELDKLPPKDKVHVVEAQKFCPHLLTDDFKLMFLRCEVFNSDLAAQRYCNYWTKRVDIFGPDRAFLPLTLDAGGALQDEETHIAFGLGVVTLLANAKDPKGRAVVYFDPSHLDRTKYTPKVLARTFWYIIHAALEDMEAQRYGVVLIADPGRAKFSQFDPAVPKIFLGSIRGALPVRMSGGHVIRPPPFFSVIYSIMKVFLSVQMRKRLRIHHGKVESIAETLQTKYGLNKVILPTTVGGSLTVQHNEWLKSRIASGL